MKRKIDLEFTLLGLFTIIGLASFLAFHNIEATGGNITQINTEGGPIANLTGQMGNTTITNSTKYVQIGIGPNVVVTGGATQTITKSLTFTQKQTFTPTSTLASINIGTITTDPSSRTNGDMWIRSDTAQVRFASGTSIYNVALQNSAQTFATGSGNIFAPSTGVTTFTPTSAPTGSSSAFINGLKINSGTTNFATNSQTGDFISLLVNQTTLKNPSSGTITNAATVKIVGPPIASTNVTISNPYSLWVASGNSLFGGNTTVNNNVNVGGNIASTVSSGTFKITSKQGVPICIGNC